MHLSSTFVGLAVALGAVGVTALPKGPSTGTVSVPLQRRADRALKRADGTLDLAKFNAERTRVRAKYARTLANYERNVGKTHPHASATKPTRRDTGTVDLTDVENQSLWTGTITFGGQDITIDFDTGSSDTLVNRGAYKPGSSSSDTGTTFSDSYGDGTTASGEVYSDNLSIGGLSASKAYIGLAKQTFITNEGGSQGISGMAFPSLSSFQQQKPFFYSLIDAGVLDNEAFVFSLAEEGSTLTLGATDSSATFTPVTDASYWTVSASVEGTDIDAVVDTGTTLIVAPVSAAESLYNKLGLQYSNDQGSVQATFDCNSPPSVSFTFGGKKITLGDSVNAGSDGNGQCVFTVVGEDMGMDSWITSDSLIDSTSKVVFDVSNQQVGFA